jgi:hypothetical protein
MHTCIHTHTHTHTAYKCFPIKPWPQLIYTCIHAYIHTYIHAYMHTYTHTHSVQMLPNQAMATIKLGDFGISKNCKFLVFMFVCMPYAHYYVCMYVCIYEGAYIRWFILVYVYTHTHTYIYTCAAWIYGHVHMYMYIFTNACAPVGMYVCR